jgi:hypothetical protein
VEVCLSFLAGAVEALKASGASECCWRMKSRRSSGQNRPTEAKKPHLPPCLRFSLNACHFFCRLFKVPDDFDAPLPDEVLALFQS